MTAQVEWPLHIFKGLCLSIHSQVYAWTTHFKKTQIPPCQACDTIKFSVHSSYTPGKMLLKAAQGQSRYFKIKGLASAVFKTLLCITWQSVCRLRARHEIWTVCIGQLFAGCKWCWSVRKHRPILTKGQAKVDGRNIRLAFVCMCIRGTNDKKEHANGLVRWVSDPSSLVFCFQQLNAPWRAQEEEWGQEPSPGCPLHFVFGDTMILYRGSRYLDFNPPAVMLIGLLSLLCLWEHPNPV